MIKPFFAQFELTEACTHSCAHCYNFYSKNRENITTQKEVIKAISKSDLFNITLTGGEPLKVKDELFDSLEIFYSENIDCSINTNLFLLNPDDVPRLKKFDSVSILSSILGPNKGIHDSITNVSGSFEKLLRSVKSLQRSEVELFMNMVVTKENFPYVYETGRLLVEQFGLKNFAATPIVVSPGRDEGKLKLSREEYVATLDTLLKLEKDLGINPDSLHPALPCMFKDSEREKYRRFFDKRACSAGIGSITFSPEGNVRVCSHDRRSYGNITEEPLEVILEKMDEWRTRKLIPQECDPCIYLKKCRGGCRVAAEATYGELDSLDPYFNHTITKRPLDEERKINMEKLVLVNGNIRFRQEDSKIKSVYLNTRVNARLDELEFELLRRYMAGKNYQEILIETNNEEVIRNASRKLVKRGFLIEKS